MQFITGKFKTSCHFYNYILIKLIIIRINGIISEDSGFVKSFNFLKKVVSKNKFIIFGLIYFGKYLISVKKFKKSL